MNRYAKLDRPDVLRTLFHPWRDDSPTPGGAVDLFFDAPEASTLHCRLHPAGEGDPVLLFFHGNGEIAADYDDTARLFTRQGFSLLMAEYRGYGRSRGEPTVSAMMRDAHLILDKALSWLPEQGLHGPLAVMGRSLGSASAIELASARPGDVAGLVVESGVAFEAPLLRLFGLDPDELGLTPEDGFRNLQKISRWTGPLLILHGEDDDLVPPNNGRALFEACPSAAKKISVIPDAGHNTILARGSYFQDLAEFRESLAPRTP
jgi:hypothetical protein